MKKSKNWKKKEGVKIEQQDSVNMPTNKKEHQDSDEVHPNQLRIKVRTESDMGKKHIAKNLETTIRYITCCEGLSKKLFDMGHRPVKTGQILGLTGAMMTLSITLPIDDPPYTALFVPGPVRLRDERSALMTVKVLQDLFGLQLDISTLDEETQRLGEKIKLIIAHIQEQIQNQLEQIRPGPPPPYMYV